MTWTETFLLLTAMSAGVVGLMFLATAVLVKVENAYGTLAANIGVGMLVVGILAGIAALVASA